MSILAKLNRYEKALHILESLWSQKEWPESLYAMLNMYQMRAELLNKMQRYEEAIQYGMKGLEKARISKTYDFAMELWITLGESYCRQGNLYDAELCFQSALKLKDSISKKYLIASIYTQLGLLYSARGDGQRSISTLQKAVHTARKINDVFRHMDSLIMIGECYQKQGIFTEAKQSLEEALQLSKQHANLKMQKKDILKKLAAVCKNFDQESYLIYVDQFFESDHEIEGGDNYMKPLTSEFFSIVERAGDPPSTD